MEYKLIVMGEFASLNEFINANRIGRGCWNKGNVMKQADQNVISYYIKQQLPNVNINKPVILSYEYYCKNKKRDLDNISGYFHKIFQDSLVQCKVLKNDSWRYIKGFDDMFFQDAKKPRIEITIKEVNGYV